MINYFIKRIGAGFFVLLIVTLITFSLTVIAPTDPAAQWAGQRPTQEQLEQAKIELGLDKPLYMRYYIYMNNLSKLDFGTSIRTRQPVSGDLKAYIPATFELVIVSTIISVIFGISLGVFSGIRRESAIDHTVRLFSISGVSVPVFWLGMMVQLISFSIIKSFPIQGRISSEIALNYPVNIVTGFYLIDTLISGNIVAFKSSLSHIFLPALTQAFMSLAIVTRMTRSSIIGILKEDYIRTAKSFGLSNNMINYKYALKNALIPTITVVGLVLGYELGGSVLVESIFDWPGLGRYIWQSILFNDYPAIMAVTIIFAITYLCINILVDLLYVVVDPRVKI